jgi:hypothetical protein
MRCSSFVVICAIASCCIALASQTPPADHLSSAEIAAAEASSGGVVEIDAGYLANSNCKGQPPSEKIFTPTGWLSTMSRQAKKQFLPYNPTADETARVLTVISKGCVAPTQAGPSCDSITRVVLISDKAGTVVVEAISQQPITQTWQNGYGAASSCASTQISRFPLADVKKVQNDKGEFMIATFNGATLLRIYKVTAKNVKDDLGL